MQGASCKVQVARCKMCRGMEAQCARVQDARVAARERARVDRVDGRRVHIGPLPLEAALAIALPLAEMEGLALLLQKGQPLLTLVALAAELRGRVRGLAREEAKHEIVLFKLPRGIRRGEAVVSKASGEPRRWSL